MFKDYKLDYERDIGQGEKRTMKQREINQISAALNKIYDGCVGRGEHCPAFSTAVVDIMGAIEKDTPTLYRPWFIDSVYKEVTA